MNCPALVLKSQSLYMPDFTVRVTGGDLLFSASHFITFESDACEALHGHDYFVTAEAHGPLNSSKYVVDFTVLREIVKGILMELDHRVLVPQNHPRIHLRTTGNELEVAFGSRRWVLPKDDCVLLPVANTTDEMLAQYLAGRISESLSARNISLPMGIKVEVRESGGFSAIYRLVGDE
jgi:6-pyruvoyltetrahydropterin/6-carboxytetrahydropterin synthase